MFNFEKILFPIDLTEKSVSLVPYVKMVAEKFDAEVHIVYVAKTNEYYREDECGNGPTNCKSGLIITRTVVEYAEKHCSLLVKPKVVVLEGEADEELLAYIERADIDLVMMATKGRSPLGKVLLGSVPGSLVRTINIPIFLVRPGRDKFLMNK